jgi:hypothetical protein
MSFRILHCVPTAHAGKIGSAFSTDILCLTAQDFSKIKNVIFKIMIAILYSPPVGAHLCVRPLCGRHDDKKGEHAGSPLRITNILQINKNE